MRLSVFVAVTAVLCLGALVSTGHQVPWERHSYASSLATGMTKMWTNAKLQKIATEPTRDSVTSWAQQEYLHPGKATADSFASGQEAAAVIKQEVGLSSAASLQDLANATQPCGPSGRSILVHRVQTAGSVGVYNGAYAYCAPGNSKWMVWMHGVGTPSLDGNTKDSVAEQVWVFESNWSPREAGVAALDVFALATVHAAANTAGVPLSLFLEAGAPLVGNSTSAFGNLDISIKSIVSAFKEIASLFGHKTTTKIIGQESCLGFNTFEQNTHVNIIQCLPDDYVKEWVEDYFDDLAVAFGGDKGKMAALLLQMEHAHATNWSANHIQLTNSGSSDVKAVKIFMNHDDEKMCCNWVVVDFSSVFTLAPDLIYWEKSTSSWGGFDTSTEVYTEQIPHKISLQDVEAIMLLFQIIAGGSLAEMRGIPYKFPDLPTCSKEGAGGELGSSPMLTENAAEVVNSATWEWVTSAWSQCSKPCGGGIATRDVVCVSSDGDTDPSGSHCDPSTKPAATMSCNNVLCPGVELLRLMKENADALYKTLPVTPPAAASKLVQDVWALGDNDMLVVPVNQSEVVLKAWTVKNHWPDSVAKDFQGIVDGAPSEQFEDFKYSYDTNHVYMAAVIGVGRKSNDTHVVLSYIMASAQGVPLARKVDQNGNVPKCCDDPLFPSCSTCHCAAVAQTASDILIVQQAMEASFRSQLPAQVNLLSIKLGLPPPYPSDPGALFMDDSENPWQ